MTKALEYPCNCDDMIFVINNLDLISKVDIHWVIKWKELDKTTNGINIENLAVKFSYCPFCGNKII